MMRSTKRTTDGRIVITREPAFGAHPHPRHAGKLYPINGVSKVLVEDEAGEPVEVHECNQCGWLAEKVASVTAHMTAHSDGHGTQYEPSVLKRVIRECLIAQRDTKKKRGYAVIVADKLNAAGITTSRGTPWTPGTVSHLFVRYRDEYRTRVPGGRDGKPRPVSAPPTNGVSLSGSIHLVLDRVEESLRQRVVELSELADVFKSIRAEIARLPQVDAQTVADAERWRKFQLLMGDSK